MVASSEPASQLRSFPVGPYLRIEPRPWDGCRRVALIGEIDLRNSREAEAILAPMASRGTPLVLDLAGLTYCDSQGISMFFRLAKRVDENGRQRLMVANPHGIVQRVMEITALDRAVDIIDEL